MLVEHAHHRGDLTFEPTQPSVDAPDQAEGDDCVRGAFCWSGRCQSPPFRAGQPCPQEYPYCEGNAVCINPTPDAELECVEVPSAGEPCLVGVFCGPGSICDPDGVCQPIPGLGDPCEADQMTPCSSCLSCVAAGNEPPTCQLDAGTPGTACRAGFCTPGSWCFEEAGVECSADPLVCWWQVDTYPPSPIRSKTCPY